MLAGIALAYQTGVLTYWPASTAVHHLLRWSTSRQRLWAHPQSLAPPSTALSFAARSKTKLRKWSACNTPLKPNCHATASR